MQALVDAARRKESMLVAGLDPVPSRFPEELRALPEADATLRFCMGILEAVEPYVAAVKIQAAFFERLGPVGMKIYEDLIGASSGLHLPVIADVKRGDIGPVAAAYAEAHLGVYGATCVTVNPYMGSDAVLPFLEEVRRQDRGGGVFVLVATSNPSSREIQEASDPPLFELAAGLVAELGRPDGDHPDAGAVVGVTRPEIGARVRELLPRDAVPLPRLRGPGRRCLGNPPPPRPPGRRRPGQQQPQHPLRPRAFGLRLQTSGQRSRPTNARRTPPVEHAPASPSLVSTALRALSARSGLAALACQQRFALRARFQLFWFGSRSAACNVPLLEAVRVYARSGAPRRLPDKAPRSAVLTSEGEAGACRQAEAEGWSVLTSGARRAQRALRTGGRRRGSSPAPLRLRPLRRKFAPCSLCSCDPFPARVHLFPSLRAVWFAFCGSSAVASSMASLRFFS